MKDLRVYIGFRTKSILMFAAGWIAVFGLEARAFSQTDPHPQTSATDAKKPLAFEVISIRRSGAAGGRPQFGPTADGFHLIGLPMLAVLQLAYAPSNEGGPLRGDRIVGVPDWLKGGEMYDVVARVDDADLADWQKPELQRTMLRAMLQTMLTERFKVVAHHESREVAVYNLVVAKSGPKFKQAETADAAELKLKHPDGGRVTGGGLALRGADGTQFYGVTMG
jgi:uncharacterized protein (TIGR03435 family)